jgi:hypothetical protein
LISHAAFALKAEAHHCHGIVTRIKPEWENPFSAACGRKAQFGNAYQGALCSELGSAPVFAVLAANGNKCVRRLVFYQKLKVVYRFYLDGRIISFGC